MGPVCVNELWLPWPIKVGNDATGAESDRRQQLPWEKEFGMKDNLLKIGLGALLAGSLVLGGSAAQAAPTATPSAMASMRAKKRVAVVHKAARMRHAEHRKLATARRHRIVRKHMRHMR